MAQLLRAPGSPGWTQARAQALMLKPTGLPVLARQSRARALVQDLTVQPRPRAAGVAEVLREALLSLGAEGDFVGNGVEAVEAAKGKVYDVIFMDGSMPEMDGFTATKLIREAETNSGGKRTFVVALTAQVRGADAEAWAQAGADRHMTKPFTSARLMEALKDAGAGTRRIVASAVEPVAEEKPAEQPVAVPRRLRRRRSTWTRW